MFLENKVRQIFRKTSISYLLIRTRMFAYQGVRDVCFLENFGVLCLLETPVLRFALFPYYRRNIIWIEVFNVESNKGNVSDFLNICNLKNLAKQKTCYKNPEKPCINLILTNYHRSSQNTFIKAWRIVWVCWTILWDWRLKV